MRALISVSDKVGIVSFAKKLESLGFEIVSTGGTYNVLKENKINVIPIDDVTEFPEMLDGRVKTLHPRIHGGLLAKRDNLDHMSICKEHGIEMIDLVVVNLYPFEKTIAKPDVTLEEAIENIDIGGPSMLRSAAKNYRSVGVVVNPDRYDDVIAELEEKGSLSLALKEALACDVFTHTANYDARIASFLGSTLLNEKRDDGFPQVITQTLTKQTDLRYGENPHQEAAFYSTNAKQGIPSLKQLHGKELSYNNIVDLESALLIVSEFDLPSAAIIKHTNPCGAAIGDSLFDAYQKAYNVDPVSAFGSIVGLNRTVDLQTAEEISKTFVEVVIAPGFEKEALDILTKKPSIRLIEISELKDKSQSYYYKHVEGGFLVQTKDTKRLTEDDLSIVTDTKPSSKEINDLLFAFTLVKHVKSNAVLIAKNGTAVGIGAGQMSRVESVDIALSKAGDQAQGAVMASDAFFPFRDSIDAASKKGIVSVIQPGGSKRDQESIDSCNEHKISMAFTGIRHFKH